MSGQIPNWNHIHMYKICLITAIMTAFSLNLCDKVSPPLMNQHFSKADLAKGVMLSESVPPFTNSVGLNFAEGRKKIGQLKI